MNDRFSTILDKHEADDNRQASLEELIKEAIKNEFANGKEILDRAESLSLTLRDFTSGKITDFPIVPIRQSDRFYIKKHTESQVPYFHSHSFYELIYVHRGRCIQQFEEGSKLCLSKGQCLLICPNAVHKIEKSKRADVILKFVIPSSLFEQTGGKVLSDRLSETTLLFENVSETATFAISKLLQEQYCNTKFKDLIIPSYLTIFFAELVNKQKTDIAIETVLSDYFDVSCKTASLAEFAATQNYNADYLSRLIKTRTGKSFSELLSFYRINRAKQLLTESDLSIEEIAFEVGYSNTSGLYKQFFSILGMRPSEYRSMLK